MEFKSLKELKTAIKTKKLKCNEFIIGEDSNGVYIYAKVIEMENGMPVDSGFDVYKTDNALEMLEEALTLLGIDVYIN